ncbi:MAG: NUDIX domain-containing protein [Chloroflexi bacterium]|nr:NUDIX domain-containing protein [Chloroflexota bacterium]
MHTVVPNVMGYLEKDDKVLLGLRKDQPLKIYRDHWDLPGGRIELGETVEEALVREFLEETGLVIMGARLMDAFGCLRWWTFREERNQAFRDCSGTSGERRNTEALYLSYRTSARGAWKHGSSVIPYLP